jgi:hypothetical protein
LIHKNEHIYGLRKQETEGLDRPIGFVPMLLMESIGKISDEFIEWKEAAFFYAEAFSVEMVRNSRL